MPDGSIHAQIETLETAFGGIIALRGEAGANGTGGTGLQGAASLTVGGPTNSVATIEVQFEGQSGQLLNFNPSEAIAQIQTLYEALEDGFQVEDLAVFAGFLERLDVAQGAFAGDWLDDIQRLLTTIQTISQGIPQNRASVFASLLDQILGALAKLGGEDAQVIISWMRALELQVREILPLIVEGQSSPDPAAFLVAVLQRAANQIFEMFGLSPVRHFFQAVESYPDSVLPQAGLTDLGSVIGELDLIYVDLNGALAGDDAGFRDAVLAGQDRVLALQRTLRPFMSVLLGITRSPIFQPGGLEAWLRELFEQGESVAVTEARNIESPYDALLDRIDEAIADIDLSVVRTEVLGFFESTRDALAEAQIDTVGDQLLASLGEIDRAVIDLQDQISDLIEQAGGAFDSLLAQLREALSALGSFDDAGTFHFNFENGLRDTLNQAKVAIGGDPNSPDSPSLAGMLHDFQSGIDSFLQSLDELLTPVGETVDGAVTTAVQGVQDFADFMDGLQIGDLMEALRAKVDEILDTLLPIDFSVVVDPIVTELKSNSDKLGKVNADELNDMLRAALAAALDVIIDIDFTVTISQPLEDQFAEVRAVPAAAIEELQRRYEEALEKLEELGPERLVEALLQAFDVIEQVVSQLDISQLFAPLDEIHQRFLMEPLQALGPDALLQPLVAGFQRAIAPLDALQGAQLVAPLDDALSQFKDQIRDFDIEAPIRELSDSLEQVKTDLREIRPSELLDGLMADWDRLVAEIDRFRPSVVFEPVTQMAQPLLDLVETVQEETVEAIHGLFAEPLSLLAKLEPQELRALVIAKIEAVEAAVATLDLANVHQRLEGSFFDVKTQVSAGGSDARLQALSVVDPGIYLGPTVQELRALQDALAAAKTNVAAFDLTDLYAVFREKIEGLLPPYAQRLTDPEAFKALMRRANPLRFLDDLDARFNEIVDRLIPVDPRELAAELDATYQAVLDQVEALGFAEGLDQVRTTLDRIKGTVDLIRIDFVAGGIDQALDDIRAVVSALDPSRLIEALNPLFEEVTAVVENTKPSVLLAGLQAPFEQIQQILTGLDLRARLEEPLRQAWEAIAALLADIDFRIILSPVDEKLAELQAAFLAALREVETEFDTMLGTAKTVVGGGGVSVSIAL
ncbi:hypothetical protein SCOR_07690 [Sulfidibacter corallicola]|uniref:Phage-related protein n=1 Tax=Sulfidibacter corallicola TaxID=2818388 RepID=A0A8A4TXU8_SULCO|nr:hypothetical protein [Sulfidibacter corallicola]QTD51355.1 hypothetical protein J3U87_02705 [Sulfidibacter corallicola]